AWFAHGMAGTQLEGECAICGRPLRQARAPLEVTCGLCGGRFDSNVVCEDGHYVCSRCHAVPAEDYIAAVCAATVERDPAALARRLMLHPAVKMHGPEHHFLVPAVLLACHANVAGEREALPTRLREARRRAQALPGCLGGTHGSCAAAVGCGVFVSALTGATPLSRAAWRQSNLATARALVRVAEAGGPRCCKRSTLLALLETVGFVAEEFGVVLPAARPIVCTHVERNAECLRLDCAFFPRPSRVREAAATGPTASAGRAAAKKAPAARKPAPKKPAPPKKPAAPKKPAPKKQIARKR
ncbi:MAG: hypothetical protein JXB32_01960, partial [Deltaproteobacteria bacterium]|nr:hypothetical protein [Deltaproteobacteria bacterium]